MMQNDGKVNHNNDSCGEESPYYTLWPLDNHSLETFIVHAKLFQLAQPYQLCFVRPLDHIWLAEQSRPGSVELVKPRSGKLKVGKHAGKMHYSPPPYTHTLPQSVI